MKKIGVLYRYNETQSTTRSFCTVTMGSKVPREAFVPLQRAPKCHEKLSYRYDGLKSTMRSFRTATTGSKVPREAFVPLRRDPKCHEKLLYCYNETYFIKNKKRFTVIKRFLIFVLKKIKNSLNSQFLLLLLECFALS